MAIAFDATSSGTVNSTSLTYSHTCTGSDRLLWVTVATNVNDTITGVTYAGVPMTLAVKGQNNTTRWGYLFYLIAPSTGANNVVVSRSSSGFIDSASVSYTGCDQTNQPDATANTTNGTTTSIDNVVTTVADNSWAISFAGIDRSTTASTGSTSRVSTPLWGSAVCDTNGPKTPAGSVTMTQTFSSVAAGSLFGVIASFKPAAGATPSPKLLTMMGVGT